MPLVPGYNFVRAGAAREFFECYQREHPGEELVSMSVVEFLRMVQHRKPPEHRCIQVTGFDALWRVCEDDPLLSNRMKQLLTARVNWIKEHLTSVYFVLPAETEFVDAVTVQLRLPSGEHVDVDRLLGKPELRERDHYQRPFILS